MQASTKRVLIYSGIAAGAVGALLLLTRSASAATPSGGGGPSPQPQPQPQPSPGGCTNWTPSTSDPDAVTIATNISYHNNPVQWTDGGTYGPVTINGRQWRFQMQWQTCTRPGDGATEPDV